MGFSPYEARLYLGLLSDGPQNGNELSRTSGVPSSKVYSTLDKLVASGIVQEHRRGTSVEYVCVPPDELMRQLREKYTRPLDYLDAALPTLAGEHTETDFVGLLGEETILERARTLIAGAAVDVYVSAWDANIDALRDSLAASVERGVRTFTMIYGDTELNVGYWLQHSYRETVATRIGGHMLTVVADGSTALIAHVPERGEASAVVTENPVLCLVVEEYLRHDLILQKAKTITGFEEWDRWLNADEDVRAITIGRAGREKPQRASRTG